MVFLSSGFDILILDCFVRVRLRGVATESHFGFLHIFFNGYGAVWVVRHRFQSKICIPKSKTVGPQYGSSHFKRHRFFMITDERADIFDPLDTACQRISP